MATEEKDDEVLMSSYELLSKLVPHYSTLSKKEEHIENDYNPIKQLKEKHRHQKKDFRMIIGGDNGNGKSALACREGETENPQTFTDKPQWAVDNQIHMFARKWLNAVTVLPTFAVNIFDEPVQGGGHHREFMSEANIIITKTVATARFKRFYIPVNIPFIDMLDKDVRKLCQVYIYAYDQGKAEAYLIMNPKFGGEPWYQKIVDELTWDMPNQVLWKLYEEKKYGGENEEYKRYQDKLSKRERDNRTDEELIESITKDFDNLIDDRTKRLNVVNIMASLSVGRDKASSLRRKYERENQPSQETQ